MREQAIKVRLTDHEKLIIQHAMDEAAKQRAGGKPRSKGADALRDAMLDWALSVVAGNDKQVANREQ